MDMGLRVLGGDIPEGTTLYMKDNFYALRLSQGAVIADFVIINDVVKSIEQITNENKSDIFAKAGWGVIGGLALGPVGFLAGMILGGKQQSVCFACELHDGRKFVADADVNTYKKLLLLSSNYEVTKADAAIKRGINVSEKQDFARIDSLSECGDMVKLYEESRRIIDMLDEHGALMDKNTASRYAAKRDSVPVKFRKYADKMAKLQGWQKFDFNGGVVFAHESLVIVSPSGLKGDYSLRLYNMDDADTRVTADKGGLLSRSKVTIYCSRPDMTQPVMSCESSMYKYFMSFCA